MLYVVHNSADNEMATSRGAYFVMNIITKLMMKQMMAGMNMSLASANLLVSCFVRVLL